MVLDIKIHANKQSVSSVCMMGSFPRSPKTPLGLSQSEELDTDWWFLRTARQMRRHMHRLHPVLTSLTAALLSTALLQRNPGTPADQSPHDPFCGLEPAALGEALMTAAVAAAPSDDQPVHATAQGAPPGLLRAAAVRCNLASDISAGLQQVHCLSCCALGEDLSPCHGACYLFSANA